MNFERIFLIAVFALLTASIAVVSLLNSAETVSAGGDLRSILGDRAGNNGGGFMDISEPAAQCNALTLHWNACVDNRKGSCTCVYSGRELSRAKYIWKCHTCPTGTLCNMTTGLC